MNHLNSVLIEGIVKKNPVMRMEDMTCTFTIANRHQTRESSFFVEVPGKLGANCQEYLKPGENVRLVGQMMEITTPLEGGDFGSYICIQAEHVQFRPSSRKESRPYAHGI